MKSYDYFQTGTRFSECVLETNHRLPSGRWRKKAGAGELHSKDTDIKENTSRHFRKWLLVTD